MATEKLDIMQTIKDGVQYGLKNFFPLLLMVILYVVTVWIPYLNVGTTIGFYKAIISIQGEEMDRIMELNSHLQARIEFLVRQIEAKDELIKKLAEKVL